MSILNFVDIETTGLHYNQDQIIEIAVIKLENHKEVDRYETLIKPTIPLNPYAQKIHGITASMLKNAPVFQDISQTLYDFLQDGTFVAHNAKFDYSFVQNTFDSHGIEFHTPYACTVKLSRYLYPEHRKHGLSAISERHNIVIEDRHRAMGDTDATVQFYQIARKEKDDKEFEEAFDRAILQKSIPAKLVEFDISNIPDNPGVYIFKNSKDEIIYIGKSIHIRSRIKEHFYASGNSTKEMDIARQVADIEWIETNGEFGALIREALLVKKHQPKFNVALKSNYSYVVIETLDPNGYKSVEINTIQSLEDLDLRNVLGMFRSKMAAFSFVQKRVDQSNLCSHILHSKKGVCFQYHMGQCNGACCGEESIQDFNQKFDDAFKYYKIPEWPLDGEFQYIDESESGKETLVFDSWRFLKSNKGLVNHSTKFDYDIYKTIKRLIFSS